MEPVFTAAAFLGFYWIGQQIGGVIYFAYEKWRARK